MKPEIFKLKSSSELPDGFMKASKRVLDGKYPCHYHEYYEIEFVINGDGVNEINGEKVPFKSGTAFLIRPTDIHEVSSFNKCDMLNVSFSQNSVSEELMTSFLSGDGFYSADFSKNQIF